MLCILHFPLKSQNILLSTIFSKTLSLRSSRDRHIFGLSSDKLSRKGCILFKYTITLNGFNCSRFQFMLFYAIRNLLHVLVMSLGGLSDTPLRRLAFLLLFSFQLFSVYSFRSWILSPDPLAVRRINFNPPNDVDFFGFCLDPQMTELCRLPPLLFRHARTHTHMK